MHLLISRGTGFGSEEWRGLLVDETDVRVQGAGVCEVDDGDGQD